MQQITFTSSAGEVTINDCGTSKMNGEGGFLNLWLNDFDGNSQALNTDTVECIGIPGQRVLNNVPKAKMITAKIGFAPIYLMDNTIVCTGERGKYELRRKLLKLFPLGETAELNYKNSYGEYRIKARLSEVPIINYEAGLYAVATLIFVADYPYWTFPLLDSETITISGGEIGEIAPSSHRGDIDSPIEVIIEAISTISASESYGRTLKIGHLSDTNTYLLGINCYQTIPAGTVLKYDVGTYGVLACYKKTASGLWVSAPEYWSIQGHERRTCSTMDEQPFGVWISSGSARAKIIFHDIVVSI
jgi:hypothetical protein